MNKLIGILRRLKISYVLYNLFHKKQLIHNEALYKSLGIKKKYYSSVCSKDFQQIMNLSSVTNNMISIQQRLKSSNAFNNLNDVKFG